MPAFTEEKYHEIPSGVLRDMIKRTLFAAATEGQVRFGATTGVLWELEDEKAALIATDGRRLAMMTAQAKPIGDHTTNIAENIHFLVHGRPLGAQPPNADDTSSLVVGPLAGR